jgi:hypothetical protein
VFRVHDVAVVRDVRMVTEVMSAGRAARHGVPG